MSEQMYQSGGGERVHPAPSAESMSNLGPAAENTASTSGSGAVAAPKDPAASQSASETAEERSRRARGAGLPASLQSLAVTVVIAVFVITFMVQAFQIPSESMENTLLIGDYLLVDKVHFSKAGVWSPLLPYDSARRGDIIVFRYPVNPQQHFVKRVIAVPGDRVHLINKRVWVNGTQVNEPYVVYRSIMRDRYRDDFPAGEYPPHVNARWWEQLPQLVEGGELRVPEGYYFVLGDNRDESLDSRYWGFVPRENIIGRPLLIYFSVAASDGPFPEAEASSGKLGRFAQAVTNVLREIRWNRTMRLVK